MTKEELMKINEKLSIELVTSSDERREEILNEKLEIYRKLEEKNMKEYKLSEVFAKLEENSKLEFEFKDDWDRTFKFCVEETNPNEKYFAFKSYSANGELNEADVPVGRFNGNCCMSSLWILVQQPVSFMEVVNCDKRVRVEHYYLDKFVPYDEEDGGYTQKMIKGEFIEFDRLLYILTNNSNAEELRDILLNGKWYVEED